MLLDFFAELAALAALMACGYVALRFFVKLKRPSLADFVVKQRLKVLGLLMAVIVGFKVSEDVFSLESKAVDESLLRLLHDIVPVSWAQFFYGVTMTGSVVTLVPVAVAVTAALLMARRRAEAVLVAASLAVASSFVYVIKTAVGRARPALWETQWFWGSSFPSGHTTDTAALSTALALSVARLWPRAGGWAMAIALTWTAMVGLSRMVLGVHWPTDVAAAMCLGVLVALMTSLCVDLYLHRGAEALSRTSAAAGSR